MKIVFEGTNILIIYFNFRVNNDNKMSLERDMPKSILSSETIYSKEHWLKNQWSNVSYI